MKCILIFVLAFLFSLPKSSGQKFSIQYQIQCDCNQSHCDTLKIQVLDSAGLIVCTYDIDSTEISNSFVYSNQSQLIRKNTFEKSGIFLNYQISYYDSNNVWIADSSFDRNNKLLFSKSIERDTKSNLTIIHWTYLDKSKPILTQRILKDEFNNELANTICSSSQNCITLKYTFNNGLKMTKETWILSSANALPVLDETVSYVYDENRILKMAVIKNGEKEECSSILFFKTIQQ